MTLKISRVNVGYYAARLKEALRPAVSPVREQLKPEDPVTRKEFIDFIDKLEHDFLRDLADDLNDISEESKGLDRKR